MLRHIHGIIQVHWVVQGAPGRVREGPGESGRVPPRVLPGVPRNTGGCKKPGNSTGVSNVFAKLHIIIPAKDPNNDCCTDGDIEKYCFSCVFQQF